MATEAAELTVYWIEEEGWMGKISGSLYNMLKNSTLCDTTLISTDKQSIACHSSVLAASSPYLQNILKTAIKNFHKVNLQVNIQFNILKQVVDFIYMGRAAIASFQAQALLDAAKQLDIDALKNACNRCIVGVREIPVEVQEEGEAVSDIAIEKTANQDMGMIRKEFDIADDDMARVDIVNTVSRVTEGGGDKAHIHVGSVMADMAEAAADSVIIDAEGNVSQEVVDMVSTEGCMTKRYADIVHREGVTDEEQVADMLSTEGAVDEEVTDMDIKNKSASDEKQNAKVLYVNEEQTEIDNSAASYVMYEWNAQNTSTHSKETGVRVEIKNLEIQNDAISEIITKPAKTTRGPMVQRPFVCRTCQRSFTQQSHLLQHERLHTGERPYICKTCNKSFVISSNLNRHLKIHTGERPYVCNICQRAFNQSSHLKQHEQSHMGHKPFQCTQCQRYFSKSSHLVRHEKIHAGKKPYKCKTCPRAYSDRIHLIEHTRIHTGERPHHCQYCSKTFTFKTSMIQHTRLHTGEKPYGCELCEARFPRKQSLKDHQKVHSNLREYVCIVCSAAFVKKRQLEVHMDMHTLEEQKDHFDCDVCGKRFRRKGSLHHHRRKMHGMLVRYENSENNEPVEMLHTMQIKKEHIDDVAPSDTEEALHTSTMNNAAEILTSLAKGLTRDTASDGENATPMAKSITTNKTTNKLVVIRPACVKQQLLSVQSKDKELEKIELNSSQKPQEASNLTQLSTVSDVVVDNPDPQLDSLDISHQIQQDFAEVKSGTDSGNIQVLQLAEDQCIPEVLQQVIQGNQHMAMVTDDGHGGQLVTEVTDVASLQAQILHQVDLGQQHEFEVLVVESLMDNLPEENEPSE